MYTENKVVFNCDLNVSRESVNFLINNVQNLAQISETGEFQDRLFNIKFKESTSKDNLELSLTATTRKPIAIPNVMGFYSNLKFNKAEVAFWGEECGVYHIDSNGIYTTDIVRTNILKEAELLISDFPILKDVVFFTFD